jgi:5-methylcytosine-specific restriction protein A
MPQRAPRICARCRALFTTARCSCVEPWATSTRRGSTRRWRLLRQYVFAEQSGLCAVDGCVELCVELDHIVGVARGGGDERSNVQGLCVEHHAEKTQRESHSG